jgi:uncharacterized membrane-anchored protein YitT (DUF2179 family)
VSILPHRIYRILGKSGYNEAVKKYADALRSSMLGRSLQAWIRGEHSPVRDVLSIIVGCLLIALGFRWLLNPNNIVAGGVMGLSTIFNRTLGWEPAIVQWCVNLTLLALSFRILGRGVAIRAALGSLLLPLCTTLTKNVPPITHIPLLAAIFGGLIYGTGVGLVLSGNGSVGGYTLLARIFIRVFPLSISTMLFTLDALTVAGSGFLLGPEPMMYALITTFVMRRSIETVLVGFSRAKVAYVMSAQQETIREKVLTQMNRGLTVLHASGGYTMDERPVLMIVLNQTEVPRLITLVREHDPEAFLVVSDVAAVMGKGFGGEV